MTAHVSMRDFARAVLPRPSDDGLLCMLAAYFDDSGSHPNSDIVLMAGFYGYPNQWDYFSDLWAKQLTHPCPGKPPISRAHMSHCQAQDEEFTGWKREETEFFVHELGTIILNSGIYGFGSAISRKDYERLITGEMRRAHGDAETMCIINTFVTLLNFAKKTSPDPHIAVVFDNRPEKKESVQKIFNVYSGFNDPVSVSMNPMLSSVSFASSKTMLPLQAADLLAWEIYQDALDALTGMRDDQGPRRQQFRRLLASGRILAQFARPENVKKMAETKVEPGLMAMIASHLDLD